MTVIKFWVGYSMSEWASRTFPGKRQASVGFFEEAGASRGLTVYRLSYQRAVVNLPER